MNNRLLSLLALLLLFALPMGLVANMANRLQAGYKLGEPIGKLDSLHIQGETLRIDLRPVEQRDPAIVEATYVITNSGAARMVDLMFIASPMRYDSTETWRVTLDGMQIPGIRKNARDDTSGVHLPEQWKLPTTTPALGNEPALKYDAWGEEVILFSVDLQAGASHTITVRYKADVTYHSSSSPLVYWQLGYVLAPARQWATFGQLKATVLVPTGWQAVAEPAMERRGDTLYAVWNGVPADAIAITAQAPMPESYTVTIQVPLIIAIILALALCLFAGMVTGRRLAHSGSTWWWGVVVGLPVGVFCAILVVMGFLIGEVRADDLLGMQGAMGYGESVASIVVYGPLSFVLGMIITFLVVRIIRQRGIAKGMGERNEG